MTSDESETLSCRRAGRLVGGVPFRVAVDDATKAAARVADLGGTVLEPPNHVPGVGTICMFKDPVGALVYMMEPEQPPIE